jgi:hypothetical protein
MESIRKAVDPLPSGLDTAFAGRYSLLNTDQGIRGVHHVYNDLSLESVHEVPFMAWFRDRHKEATDPAEVTSALDDLNASPIGEFSLRIARQLTSFDWRTATTPGINEEDRLKQLVYRTGTGYRELRLAAFRHIRQGSDRALAAAAERLLLATGGTTSQ